MSTRISVGVGDHPFFLVDGKIVKFSLWLVWLQHFGHTMHALRRPQPKLNFKN